MEGLGTPATERETIRGHMFRLSDAGSIWKLDICRVCGDASPAHDHMLRFSARFNSPGGVCSRCLAHLPRSPRKVGTVETMLCGVGAELTALARTMGQRREIVRQDLLRLQAAGKAEIRGSLWYRVEEPQIPDDVPSEADLFGNGG